MCGRYLLTHSAADIAAFFRTIPTPAEHASGGNISPMQSILVVTGGDEPRLTAMRWGIVPRWAVATRSGRPVINARSETLTEKPLFRNLLEAHRCVVPASGYYEWPKGRPPRSKPFEIAFAGGELMAMAALWTSSTVDEGPNMPACVIITTAPAAEIASFHDRMPALLSREGIDLWLSGDTPVPAATALLQAWPFDRLKAEDTARRTMASAGGRLNDRGEVPQLKLWEDL